MKAANIDVTKLDKSRIKTVVKKDGTTAKFLDLVFFDRPDDFGNDGFVTQSLTKDERAQGIKLPILGNWKNLGERREQSSHNQSKSNGYAPADRDDDINF